jgi:hypothetical protein
MELRHSAENGNSESYAFQLDERIRAVVILPLAAPALVGLAFGALVMLTSPVGWLWKASNHIATTAEAAMPYEAPSGRP